MSLFPLKSLQQRLALFLLLPVTLLLAAMGGAGYLYARNSLLAQWSEASLLKLQRAAHQVDMRLSRPKEWMAALLQTGQAPCSPRFRESVVRQLKGLQGVAAVSWGRTAERCQQVGSLPGPWPAVAVQVRSPGYGPDPTQRTVTLLAPLRDPRQEPVGGLSVKLRFDHLLDAVTAWNWWEVHKTFLVDARGLILACNISPEPARLARFHPQLWERMKQQRSGTFIQGDQVIGFHQLEQAPWRLVIIAPSEAVLSPVLRFQSIYLMAGAAFILVILVIIRMAVGRAVTLVRQVSRAARNIAQGRYDPLLPASRADEIGELVASFNTMIAQLEEREQLKAALHLAMEVQQNLLPENAWDAGSLEFAGKSLYCDETGGDYYDFLSGSRFGSLGVAVGDVADHGISAALLMATVRALLRSRMAQPGPLAEIISDVNRLLCLDTGESGNFMTLFFLLLEPGQNRLRWVRAGHDPALLYDPGTDGFTELNGSGLALGIDPDWRYQEHCYEGWKPGQILLIGTDGIWEAENPSGERFGKKRLRGAVRKNSQRSAAALLEAVMAAVTGFRETAHQADDITLVVIRERADGYWEPEKS